MSTTPTHSAAQDHASRLAAGQACLDAALHRFLRAHSIDMLRIVVGLVILAFGVLKFFPGVSPAEELTKMTTDKLSFGLVPGHIAIVIVATLESVIGLLLIPFLELWGLFWSGWNWTNLGHLVGLVCGIAAVLLLPTRVTMKRRSVYA